MKKVFTICLLLGLLKFNGSAQYIINNELFVFVQNTVDSATDKTVVGYNPNSTNSFDDKYDSIKSPNAANMPTLYTLNNGQWLSTDILNSISSVQNFYMGFVPGTSGDFVMNFKGTKSFDPTTYLYLEDLRDKVQHNIKNGDYHFSADSTEDRDRFMLYFTPPAVVTTTSATCSGLGTIEVKQPGEAYWNYVLADPTTNFNMTGVPHANSPITATVPAGSYILTLTDTNNYKATETILVSGLEPISATFTTPSLNVNTQTAVNFTSTSQNANNYTWDFGDGTTATGVTTTSHTYTIAGNYTVSLIVTNTSGCSASAAQSITVNSTTTGINEVEAGSIKMWSHENNFYVDFTKMAKVDAVVRVYDMLGREYCSDKVSSSTLYQRQLDLIDGAYMIVSVTDGGKTTSNKLFISTGK